jgi:YidC/Oxa1 family membrane protein insertase
MEKRLLIAVLLMGAVIMITNVFFPPVPAADPAAKADSAVVAPARPAAGASPVLVAAPAAPTDSVVVRSDLYEYVFSTRGAALTRAALLRYPSYTQPGKTVQLVPAGTTDFLAHRLVVGADTIDLRGAPFQASARALRVDSAGGAQTVRFTYTHPSGFAAELTYTFRPGEYLVGVQGRVTGLTGRATLLTDVGPGLAPHEAFDHHSERELALVTRVAGKVDRQRLAKLEGTTTIEGPLAWAGIKDKYFLAAIVAGDDRPMSGGRVLDLADVRQAFVEDGDTSVVELPRAALTTELPLAADGTFAFQAYLGPQEYGRLKAVGYELEDATPYGYRWLQPVIRPFAALIVSILNFLHDSLGIGYGWVLIIFGVMMRVVLWPLNARAMRAQMKNAAVAPMMQEIREKYADNPQKQQEEMLRLYKEEGFNPMAGCLPMLVPFPVLITLFFVFQSTIGFRGADFLWLPDLSLRDPWYILPVFLVVSMFALQWISTKMSGMEQNPQMKMMMYVMPLMIGVFFFSMPAGLNLYYAATNVASMPQQMLIARERRRAQEAQKNAPKPKPEATPAAPKGKRKKV